ncbi:FCD domain-containing protein [Aureimonas fodinaquatilis]|uniref:FCD domain-containing protein n=1 Tax=Aureimonas fodinaquatilis TaxID=2565783 RepID=A0A5B0DWR8_9HYPH|nr:GntR family transcriptional regulator [Aureimonas fodinaquatilis]KAA0969649.1 FCD domain-containing protein [Aureimonas fodinaquatilis]
MSDFPPTNEPELFRGSDNVGEQIERVRSEVIAMLDRGEISPGERLLEARLARRLNVSRNIAREALRALEQVGIVRIVPNRGAEVRKLSMEDALELYDLRAGLARTAARLAAKRINRIQLDEMQELQRQLQHAVNHDDALLYNTINHRFHEIVFKAARNTRLASYNAMVEDELRLFLNRTFYSASAFASSWEEHQRVLDGLLEGDEKKSSDAFENHIIGGKARLINGEVSLRF